MGIGCSLRVGSRPIRLKTSSPSMDREFLDHSQAQKDFRAVVILLVSEDYPASQKRLERLSDDVLWFSHAGKDEFRPA